jgi:hypothetical protein
MSMNIYTDLWLSPKDYERPKFRKLFDNGGWDFEFEGEDNKPDAEGLIHLYAPEHASFDEMQQLAADGLAFFAREDSRSESEGMQSLYVAHRRRTVYIQEDGSGCPVVPVKQDGKPDRELLKAARQFHRLKAKVVTHALKQAQPEASHA